MSCIELCSVVRVIVMSCMVYARSRTASPVHLADPRMLSPAFAAHEG